MAKFTAIDRCAGGNHIFFTIQRTAGNTISRTKDMTELVGPAPQTEEYLNERINLLVREAQAAGHTGYQAIRTYLLGIEWVE